MDIPKPEKWSSERIGRKEARFPKSIMSFLAFVNKRKQLMWNQNIPWDTGDQEDAKKDYQKYVGNEKRKALTANL